MTTANKLTILRVLMIPAFLVVLYWGFPGSRYVALGIYIVACLTDLLDGYIARHYNQVSDFGKFMDPLADQVSGDGGAVLVRGGGHLLRVGVGHRAAAGVCCVRYAFGGRGEGPGHRRWLVR